MNVIMRNYCIGAASFTGIYKGCLLWNAEIQTWDDDYKKVMRPLFLGEKMVVLGASVAVSPALAPLWVANCLDRVDIYMRGKQPKDYSYETTKRFLMHYIVA